MIIRRDIITSKDEVIGEWEDYEQEWLRKRAASFFDMEHCRELSSGAGRCYLYLSNLPTGININITGLSKLLKRTEGTIINYFNDLKKRDLILIENNDDSTILYIGSGMVGAKAVKELWTELDKN